MFCCLVKIFFLVANFSKLSFIFLRSCTPFQWKKKETPKFICFEQNIFTSIYFICKTCQFIVAHFVCDEFFVFKFIINIFFLFYFVHKCVHITTIHYFYDFFCRFLLSTRIKINGSGSCISVFVVCLPVNIDECAV